MPTGLIQNAFTQTTENSLLQIKSGEGHKRKEIDLLLVSMADGEPNFLHYICPPLHISRAVDRRKFPSPDTCQ
jgi:hypothetical protein